MHAARHTCAALLLLSRGRYVARQRAACARGRMMPVVVRGAQCGAFSAPLCTAAGPDLPGSLPGAAQRAAHTLRTVSYGCIVPLACVRGEHRAAFCAPTAARPTAHRHASQRLWCVIKCHAPPSMSVCACCPRLRSCSALSSAVLCPAGLVGFPPTLLQAASARHQRGQRRPG